MRSNMSGRIFVVNSLDIQSAPRNICHCYSLDYFERKYVSMGPNFKHHTGYRPFQQRPSTGAETVNSPMPCV